jgi:hypothetical protein
MAELTPLDEKLGEVLGLAQAAQDATSKVAKMEGADDFKTDLDRMSEEAAETQRRTEELVGSLEGKKTAIEEKARETKSEATEMMKTYLEGEEEALDLGDRPDDGPDDRRAAGHRAGRLGRRRPAQALRARPRGEPRARRGGGRLLR